MPTLKPWVVNAAVSRTLVRAPHEADEVKLKTLQALAALSATLFPKRTSETLERCLALVSVLPVSDESVRGLRIGVEHGSHENAPGLRVPYREPNVD